METEEVKGRIRAMRAQGLTPEQVAELVGVSWRTIMRWEKGDTTPDNRAILDALSRASAPFYKGAV
jgi:DNA-binding XRE family transcriptional regulator